MPGDQRLSPSLTPSKTYTNPDRSTTSGKNRSSRRALHLGSSDGLNHPDINNKDLDDDSRRVSVPGPPRGGRVFNPSKGKGGFNNATSSQRRVNEPDAPWATRLRLKLRDPRVMTDEDRINNIEDPSENDDVLRGTLEDLRALYTPGNEKPEGFEVSLTSPRSCIVCLKAGCDPSSLVPRPDPVFSKTPSSINARRRKETEMRLDALLARREALGGDPHEVKQLAKELSGAADAELKARERENERKKKRDATDEKVFAALAKAEADADRVLDDLNAIASAASHEELEQAGELARERERVREKEAARSRNLTNGGTKATSKKEKGKVSTLDETTPSPSPSPSPRARQTPYGSLTPRPSSAAGSYGSPGRLVRKANTPCFSGKKAEFLSSSPRVESDASRSRIDHAEIERRTLAALEREKYESTRADAEREEALAKKRADLARIEEEVRASVERRRVEDREFSAAMRERTRVRLEEERAVEEKERNAEDARVSATATTREAFGRNAGAMLPTGIEPGYSVPLAGAPSPTPTPKKKRPGSAPPYAASPLSHTSSHSPSSIVIPDLSDNKGVKARARAAQREQLELVEAEERAAFEAAAAELAAQKIARARLQREADALVRQERRVAEKQRRLDGVARRKEAHLARLDAEREATRERTAMRLDAVRKKKEAIEAEHVAELARRAAEQEEAQKTAALARAKARATDAEWRASIARRRHVKFAEASTKLEARLLSESQRVSEELAEDEYVYLSNRRSKVEHIADVTDGVMASAIEYEGKAETELARREASMDRMVFASSDEIGVFSTGLGDSGRAAASPVGTKAQTLSHFTHRGDPDGDGDGDEEEPGGGVRLLDKLEALDASLGSAHGPGALFERYY